MEPMALAAVALAMCAYGGVSGRAERSPFTAPMFFTLVGVGMSDLGLGWLDMDLGGQVIHGLAELTLVLVLFTDAARIDLSCLRRERALPARLLGIGMPLTIAVGAVAALLVFPELELIEAALLAAILTPTDAALGQAVVSNASVPVRIRQTLNVESGLNDGIALPVVLILASMAGAVEQEGTASYWARYAALAVTLGPLAGLGVGWVGGRLIGWGTSTGWVNPPFQRISALGLALLSFGAAETVGGNGFIAAFVAGLVVGNATRGICTCLYEFGEAEGQLFGLLVFVVFGASMVPEALPHWGPDAWSYAILSLTVVRMLPVALSLVGSDLRAPSMAFLGWFGPRGLASILFALLVVESGRLEAGPLLESVVILTVLLSTMLHGLTAYPLASRYGAWAMGSEGAAAERKPVDELPVRIRHSAGEAAPASSGGSS